MDLTLFQKILEKEPKYRLKQAKKALFRDLIQNWQEATNLPLNLRNKLDGKCPIGISAENFTSSNSRTVKALVVLKDGLKIESVLMRHEAGRNTVCVSSQAGCPLGCVFCATGQTGFKRNLDTWEIVEQVLFFARYLKKTKDKVNSIVFMGMGEPFLNYQNVIEAIKILNNDDGFGLGARHFSISTAGVTEGIKKLAEEKLQINLAISLHAPNDKLRSKLMPVNEKYPIEKVLSAVQDYVQKTRRRVMFEYIMIKDVNDSEKCAKELGKLLKKNLYFVNLISYNPTGIFEPSANLRIKVFKDILEKRGITVVQRYRFGAGIKAACGQLTAKTSTS